jgi:serine/threonine protein kinase/predicted ATPase
MSDAVLFGNYELLDRIGEGGMAEVWRARSRGVAGFEKTVVIKRVLPSLMAKKTFAELLIREAKIAALLSHPNVVQIFDLGEQEGAYFIAMEYVHGRDLGQAMSYKPRSDRDAQGLDLALKLWILSQACRALDYAHRRRGADGRPLNIVHRDVSPQNILLGYEGHVKVADFGIARADEAELGKGEDPKVLRGKYAYMSPEQSRGEPLDRRSDLFALGIVLYELIVGKRLFRAKTTRETLDRVRRAYVPPIDTEAVGVPKSILPIVEKSLAVERDDRYDNAGDMAEDLGGVLFDMRAQVDERDLAEVMLEMFPPEDKASPNKLRVDLMMRAYDDASLVSTPAKTEVTPMSHISGTKEHTMAFPASRRIHSETREIVVLAVGERDDDSSTFESVVTTMGGFALPPLDGVREAVFGHTTGVERGALHAARAALEFRRRLALDGPTRIDPTPSAAIVRGDARVFEVGAIEPEDDVHESALALVRAASAGEIHVHSDLRAALARTFQVSEGETPLLVGYRSRQDRDALAMRERAPLIGRRAEVRKLSEPLVRAAEGGHAGAYLVVGEPGSGKSRLVAELGALASGQDFALVRGRGDETQSDGAYGALADVFRDLCGVELSDSPSERFAKVDRLRVLNLKPREVRLVGELLGLNYPVARDERPGRPRGLELMLAARKALRALSADRAVLLALEDVNWMDDATRQILPFLIRGLERSRVLTVMTARPGTPLPDEQVEVVHLSRLDQRPAMRLFAAAVNAKDCEEELGPRIMEETAGNPGWVQAMADALNQAGVVSVEDDVARVTSNEPTPVTAHQRALIATGLAELRPLDRSILRAAAAFDGPVEIDVLRASVGAGHEEGEAAIRRLLVQRLLEAVGKGLPQGPPREWWPGSGVWGGTSDDHPVPSLVRVPGSLLRRALEDSVGDMELRRLHGAIAAVLERTGAAGDADRIASLAHHAARSMDRRRAPDYLIRAADHAEERGELGSAAEYLAHAAKIVRESNEELGEDSVTLALRATELALSGGAIAIADAAIDEAERTTTARTEPAVKVRIALARARVAARRERWDDAASSLAQVTDAIETLADEGLRGEALLTLGRVEMEAGRPESAAAILERAIETLEKASEDDLSGVAHARAAVAFARAARFDEADDAVSSALAIAARLGSGRLRHRSLAAMGAVAEARGSMKSASARYREAAQVAEEEGAEASAARAHVLAAATCLENDDPAQAAVHAEAAHRLGRRHGLHSVTHLASAIQGALAIAEHPDVSYVPGIVRAIDQLEEAGRSGATAIALSMLARAHVVLGDSGAAQRTLERAATFASRAGHVPFERRLRDQARALQG